MKMKEYVLNNILLFPMLSSMIMWSNYTFNMHNCIKCSTNTNIMMNICLILAVVLYLKSVFDTKQWCTVTKQAISYEGKQIHILRKLKTSLMYKLIVF
jgi:hypothetical protein